MHQYLSTAASFVDDLQCKLLSRRPVNQSKDNWGLLRWISDCCELLKSHVCVLPLHTLLHHSEVSVPDHFPHFVFFIDHRWRHCQITVDCRKTKRAPQRLRFLLPFTQRNVTSQTFSVFVWLLRFSVHVGRRRASRRNLLKGTKSVIWHLKNTINHWYLETPLCPGARGGGATSRRLPRGRVVARFKKTKTKKNLWIHTFYLHYLLKC